MAVVKFGAIITDTRGSIGGHTIKGSKTATVLARRATPTYKVSSASSGARAVIATLTRNWSSELSPGQRADWESLAATVPKTDRWGNEYYSTGYALFVGANEVRYYCGLSTLLDAPADQSITALATVSLSATAPNTVDLTFTATPLAANHALWVMGAPPGNPGRTSYAHSHALLAISASAINSPYSTGPAYVARFGTFPAGRRIPVAIRVVNKSNGARSPLIELAEIAS